MRRSAGLMPRTVASTVSPCLTTSLGLRTFFDHDISERWIRPSTPGSSSTKAPKSTMRVTIPRTSASPPCILRHRIPGMRLKLLQADRNAPLAPSSAIFSTLTSISWPDGEHVRGLVHSAPGDVADVQQGVHAVDVHEGADSLVRLRTVPRTVSPSVNSE